MRCPFFNHTLVLLIDHGDGLQTRDYVHVSDVVAANLAALGRPGFHIYNVGTGVETNVVQIYELGEDQGSYYLAMEYIPGETLRAKNASCPARSSR